jgi:uncharacterized protein
MAMQLTVAQARRVALAAQGFGAARPSGRVDARHLRKVLERLKIIQVDSVNVLVRSQELPLFARLGPHPRTLLPDAIDRGELFEYWAHEAALVPIELRPHMGYRMQRARDGQMYAGLRQLAERRPEFVAGVLEEVRAHGPMVASAVSSFVGKSGSWWSWDDTKAALEYLFWTGDLTARRKANNFERVYAVPDALFPEHVVAQPPLDPAHAQRELTLASVDALGVGTATDIADYFRQKNATVKAILPELVDSGDVVSVSVDGWKEPGFALATMKVPRTLGARALLSPFDPVVWCRPRTERLFDFHYRIEIYTPAPKRTYGYYVLPFLLGDQLVGRTCLKADRANATLQVNTAWMEPGHDAGVVAGALAEELRLMAQWLELDSISTPERGNLASDVAHALSNG